MVPDSQFESELPELDPEMDRPLEPIETFDVAPDGGLAPPASTPDDPALTQPLPPISSFVVETPATPAGEADDAVEVSRIRYTLVV